MADERDNHGAEKAGSPEAERSTSGPDSERPTVSPPFDPIAFARDVLKPSPSPMKAVGSDTHTRSTPAAGQPRAKAPRRKTPTSTLSLANARIPSNLPPRPGKDLPKSDPTMPVLNPVDREWADLEIATRPPPADGPGEDPVLEIGQDRSPPSLDLDEVELGHDDLTAIGGDEEPEPAAATVRRPVPSEELRASAEPVKSRHREMNDRISLGDYSGALEIAEQILADSPNDLSARASAETCRSILRQMYATRIGPLDRVPVVMVPRDQLRWLSIDHKAGFVLSLVDGVSNLEMIIDVSGMPELDTLRILSELAQQRIISLR